MGLLTQQELDPLQEVRRAAEQHLDAIRSIALARRDALPPIRRSLDATENVVAEHDRFSKLEDIVGALQTIYDAVSELEFEEEQPVEAIEPEPEEPEEEPEDEEENDDDDNGDDDDD